MQTGFVLITEAPLWFLIFCLLFGAGLSLILYFRNPSSAVPQMLQRWLAAVRFIVISLIAFLLLNPLVKRMTRESEPPVVIVALDNSQSMLIHSEDTLADAAFLRDIKERLQSELGRRYEVDLLTFGETVSDTTTAHFTEKETDIAEVFSVIENRYAGRNAGALVLVTDGIYNKGLNPTYYTTRLNLPVYSVMWGDTTRKRDLMLAEVNYNRIAFLGNKFPMEVVVRANRSAGLSSRLVIRNREKVLHSIPFTIHNDPFVQIFQVDLLAEQEGVLDFDVSVEALPDEVTLANNRTRAFVEVLSGKKRVLLLAAKPHPDVGAIHQALKYNAQLESEVFMVDDFPSGNQPWDLVILHQIPFDQRTTDLYQSLLNQRTPMMIIGGGNTRMEVLTGTGAAPSLGGGNLRGRFNDVTASLNQGFALFTPEPRFTEQISDLPPLYVPFGRTEPLSGEQPMFYQQIGRVSTNYPLISFNSTNGIRTCYIGGEGIWRWRLHSFRNTDSHRPFNTFVNQMVQYLTAADDRTRFRVSAQGFYNETEQLTMTAELYDAAFNPVTDPEVNIRFENAENQMQYDFTFSRRERHYTLDAGRLPVGEYRYLASTTLGNERFSAQGKFVVSPTNLEANITEANHSLLKTLSQQTEGIAVAPDQTAQIIQHIQQREDIKPVVHPREKFTDITSIYWILAFIMALLALEWFLRKREGAY